MRPLRYRELVKPRRIRLIILAIWIYMPLASIAMFAVYGKGTDGIDKSPCSLLNTLPAWFFFGLLFPHLLIPAVISKVLYIRIMYVAWRQESKIYAERCLHSKGIMSKREAKAAKMMAKIVFLFTVCYSPYLIFHICIYIMEFSTPDWLFHAMELSKILMLTNSCMSPIIYFWKNRDFRRALGQCMPCYSNDQPMPMGSPSRTTNHNGELSLNIISKHRRSTVHAQYANTDLGLE